MSNRYRSVSDNIFDEEGGVEDLFDSVSDIEKDLIDKETINPFTRLHEMIDREDGYD